MQKRSIVLSDELIEKIEQFAIEERRKFSPTVAILIEKALKEIERNRNRKRGASKGMDWASFGRALSGTVPIPEGILNRVAMDDSGQIVTYKSPKPLSSIELLDKDKIQEVYFPEYHPELNIQSTGEIKTENR